MTTPHDLTTTRVPVAELRTYHRNPRRGNTAVIAQSLTVNGQYRPIVVNAGTHTGRPGEVLAGNHTLMAARDLGWADVAAVTVDVDEDQAARIVAADNRTADLGEYDDRLLLELLADLPDLDGTGYDPGDLEALEAALADEVDAASGGGDPDSAPEAPAKPVSAFGDLWLLGPHRLLCGDSDDVHAHDRLLDGIRPDMIFTDPPYGMNLQADYSKVGHGGGKAYAQIAGDDEPYDASSLIAMYDDVAEQFWWGADYYRRTIPDGGSWIAWDKRHNDEGMELDKLFGASFELCWSRRQHKREVARILWAMTHGSQRPGEDAKRGLHPTQKPTALVRWFFDRWGKSGDVVADFYGGSGTTLIGCEQAGRTARLIELDPGYVDVICRRYQEHTGTLPTRDGIPHDFTTDI
jgi:site-specific DNA-methyltransferase (adenine-specific)